MDGMKKFYQNEYASAEAITNPGLGPKLRDIREIVRVWTDPEHRKQGYATELMKTICEEADLTKTVLMLNPKMFGNPGLKELPRWYARFGFMTIQQSPHLMARMPQVYKTKFSTIAGAASEVVRG